MADCSDAAIPAYQASLEHFCANRFTTLENFDSNNAILKTAHNVALARFIASLPTGSAPIRVQGFAQLSEIDPAEISRRRAHAVSDYLTRHGMASSRVTIESFGGNGHVLPQLPPVPGRATGEFKFQYRADEKPECFLIPSSGSRVD